MSPRIEIQKLSSNPHQPDRPKGLIANIPDKDGVYELDSGGTVIVEMNPPESQSEQRKAISLTSDLFEGHLRSNGKRGEKRRIIYLSKDGEGTVQLSNYEILRVSRQSPFLKLV